jgi:flagellar basal-body rod modification protein FlgD
MLQTKKVKCRMGVQISELQEDGMAAPAGLLNHAAASGQPLANARVSPMASSGSDANSNGGAKPSASGITANDFLTLLVTEMKNQDPTANTDPNQYINQLVNVNSLQQLISINETLNGAFGNFDGSSQTGPAAQTTSTKPVAVDAIAALPSMSQSGSTPGPVTNASTDGDATLQAFISKLAHGNLSAPGANAAAERLAHALDGHSNVNLSR